MPFYYVLILRPESSTEWNTGPLSKVWHACRQFRSMVRSAQVLELLIIQSVLFIWQQQRPIYQLKILKKTNLPSAYQKVPQDVIFENVLFYTSKIEWPIRNEFSPYRKVRFLNVCLAILESSATLAIKKMPTFYYHLVRYYNHQNTWSTSDIKTWINAS